MKETLTVIAHSDNRPRAHQGKGEPEPAVQLLIHAGGDVHSISFSPSYAPAIAKAIQKAGRAARQIKECEQQFVISDSERN